MRASLFSDQLQVPIYSCAFNYICIHIDTINVSVTHIYLFFELNMYPYTYICIYLYIYLSAVYVMMGGTLASLFSDQLQVPIYPYSFNHVCIHKDTINVSVTHIYLFIELNMYPYIYMHISIHLSIRRLRHDGRHARFSLFGSAPGTHISIFIQPNMYPQRYNKCICHTHIPIHWIKYVSIYIYAYIYTSIYPPCTSWWAARRASLFSDHLQVKTYTHSFNYICIHNISIYQSIYLYSHAWWGGCALPSSRISSRWTNIIYICISLSLYRSVWIHRFAL